MPVGVIRNPPTTVMALSVARVIPEGDFPMYRADDDGCQELSSHDRDETSGTYESRRQKVTQHCPRGVGA